MTDQLPWDIAPSLSLDRLQLIAGTVRRVRKEVALQLETAKGDWHFGRWVCGVTSHARVAFEIAAMSNSSLPAFEWLRVVDGSLQFTFAIGGIPVRLYTGDAEEPTRGAKKISLRERMAQVEAFELDTITRHGSEWVWRMAVEPAANGEALLITLVQVSQDGEVKNAFPIPMDDAGRGLASTYSFRQPGVELPKPTVELLNSEAATGTDGDQSDDTSGFGNESQ